MNGARMTIIPLRPLIDLKKLQSDLCAAEEIFAAEPNEQNLLAVFLIYQEEIKLRARGILSADELSACTTIKYQQLTIQMHRAWGIIQNGNYIGSRYQRKKIDNA